jgi:hypothetical protein
MDVVYTATARAEAVGIPVQVKMKNEPTKRVRFAPRTVGAPAT